MDKLILASRNKNKIEEMKQLVAHLGIDVFSALDFPDLEEVEETTAPNPTADELAKQLDMPFDEFIRKVADLDIVIKNENQVISDEDKEKIRTLFN